MMWQMWTAFGIMFGDLLDVVFYFVPEHKKGVSGLGWRLMLGSAGVPAFFVCLQVRLVLVPLPYSQKDDEKTSIANEDIIALASAVQSFRVASN